MTSMPVPEDDGAARHLPGLSLPDLHLPGTHGTMVDLRRLPEPRTVLYVYPMTGRPGVDLPPGWDLIPGARGCTPEACSFRDHLADLEAAGAAAVFGLSSQDTAYQQEVVERLHLPFALLSDEQLALAGALRLPTFTTSGLRLYKRLTMVIEEGVVEHVFYPVFPPDTHAQEVGDWLRSR